MDRVGAWSAHWHRSAFMRSVEGCGWRLRTWTSVRHYGAMRYTGFSWTAGSRKHRVSRSQVRFVVHEARVTFVRPAEPPQRPDEALLFVGEDESGVAVEVVGVELADGRLRVIHAMTMRSSYQRLYEEARSWRQ